MDTNMAAAALHEILLTKGYLNITLTHYDDGYIAIFNLVSLTSPATTRLRQDAQLGLFMNAAAAEYRGQLKSGVGGTADSRFPNSVLTVIIVDMTMAMAICRAKVKAE